MEYEGWTFQCVNPYLPGDCAKGMEQNMKGRPFLFVVMEGLQIMKIIPLCVQAYNGTSHRRGGPFVKRVSNVTVRKRLAIALIVGVLIFSIIDLRLGYVQFFMGDRKSVV